MSEVNACCCIRKVACCIRKIAPYGFIGNFATDGFWRAASRSTTMAASGADAHAFAAGALNRDLRRSRQGEQMIEITRDVLSLARKRQIAGAVANERAAGRGSPPSAGEGVESHSPRTMTEIKRHVNCV
jgi:hypothetical protein